jgi:hypothetical protein
MKLVLGAVASLALVLLLAGRATASARGTSQTGPFDAQALQIVSDLSTGDFTDVEAQFDPTMSAALPQDALAQAWTTYQQMLGTFQSAGQPTSVMLGALTVEQVPVQLAQGPGEVRVTFHPDGTVAGLYFLQPGLPVG